MNIRTKRLVLRPFSNSDKKWYYELVQNEDVKKRLKNLATTDLEQASRCVEIFSKADFENKFYYVITDKRKNIIGIIFGIRITLATIDVAYFLKEEYRHKGYMNEALKAFVHNIELKDSGNRFRMVIDLDNIPSLNVAKRLGAIVEVHNGRYVCYC